MAPRPEEPRRDATGSRRGSSRAAGNRGGEPREPGVGGISDARSYTPRGRTVRESRDERAGFARGTGREDRAARETGLPGRSEREERTAAARRTTGADQRRNPRGGRSADPFRPALQVLDGGRTGAGRTGRRAATATRTTVIRTVDPAGAPGSEETPPPRRRTPRPASAVRRPVRKPRRAPLLADSRRRLRLGTVLTLALFAVIGIRLVALQAVEAPAYAGGGVADRLRTVELPAARGAIYDRDGNPLAHSVEARYVFADPTRVKDIPATAKALSPLLGIPASDLAERMAPRTREDGRESEFEYLARGVEIDTARKIMALELSGIGAHRDERREVPGGDLAANLIGFTSQDMVGLEGLEARYDDLLAGEDGKRVFEIGKGDLSAPIPGGYRETTEAKPGSSLTLTTDRDLQYRTQEILSDRMAKVSGSTGAAVVIEIPSGEILAQASHPTYNAAAPDKSKPTDREDAATSFVVDPGSVHKAITFGAALQEGVIKPDTAFPVENSIVKGDTRFSDSHPADGRRMSLPGMMAYSSNVGTIKIADQLGKEKLYAYQQRFGLGKRTEVGMPGEAPGRLLPPSEWSDSSYGSVPIGHSVDATPLQMAAVYATIANNGTWVQPRLVKETIDPNGKRTPTKAPATRKVLSPENAAALRHILEAVTTVEDATGLTAAIPGYRVAGKTGTGWRLVDGKKQPGEVASFIGMAPAENPRYVIAVFAHTPGGGGGAIAGPAFRDMMGFTLRHFKVPPTGDKRPEFTVYPR
ncbi:peptidoglycan D,D-transpeptidase FtsI family protein [Micromonospora inyonensis]|uniref:Peptidoglycan synthetase FtsI n=1 Tax=Micromonospora inyonensis TaxID=47866 RepID=A0A1C6S284_9ACTN|nr:penicillin-binding protein 2 [Micromonospora inyonensis]SCL23599.1 peptidoglycan synthetase FtsI [Micromonospora inyonensis]